jgi:hypothetical protein
MLADNPTGIAFRRGVRLRHPRYCNAPREYDTSRVCAGFASESPYLQAVSLRTRIAGFRFQECGDTRQASLSSSMRRVMLAYSKTVDPDAWAYRSSSS